MMSGNKKSARSFRADSQALELYNFRCAAEAVDCSCGVLTGIRRAAVTVFVHEISYDVLAESLAEVEYMVLKAQLFGQMLGFHNRLHRAAAFLLCQATLADGVERAESDSDQVVALF